MLAMEIPMFWSIDNTSGFFRGNFSNCSTLRAPNFRIASYLDNWLALNLLKRLLFQDREKCPNLLVALGFKLNKEKSELIPKQDFVYIEVAFHLKLGIITPTPEI